MTEQTLTKAAASFNRGQHGGGKKETESEREHENFTFSPPRGVISTKFHQFRAFINSYNVQNTKMRVFFKQKLMKIVKVI